MGGVTLEVEVNVLPGKGELVLTGKLGDVMKESAQAALSYVRSISEEYGIDAEFIRSMTSIYISRRAQCQRTDHPQASLWRQPCSRLLQTELSGQM